MNRKNGYKVINCNDFHKIAEACRAMSASIMSDEKIVKQFNELSIKKREKILKDLQKIKVNRNLDTFDEQHALTIVEIHMISGKYSIDPAVVFMTGVCKNGEKIKIV